LSKLLNAIQKSVIVVILIPILMPSFDAHQADAPMLACFDVRLSPLGEPQSLA
jgi:hypothetical protein